MIWWQRPPRGEQKRQTAHSMWQGSVASARKFSKKASVRNGTQKNKIPKVLPNFPKRFSKGFCPKGVPKTFVQQAGQATACANQADNFFLTKQLASAFAQTFSYHVGEHARAKTAKIHRTAAASTSSAGGAHRMYGKYGLVRLNEIGRLSLLKEAVLVSCLAFFHPSGAAVTLKTPTTKYFGSSLALLSCSKMSHAYQDVKMIPYLTWTPQPAKTRPNDLAKGDWAHIAS